MEIFKYIEMEVVYIDTTFPSALTLPFLLSYYLSAYLTILVLCNIIVSVCRLYFNFIYYTFP